MIVVLVDLYRYLHDSLSINKVPTKYVDKSVKIFGHCLIEVYFVR